MASVTDINFDGRIDYRDGVTDGYDYINGTHGNNVIFGLGGGDNIYAHGGDDIIKGGGGADTIMGGLGADTIFGDEGVDTASYLDSAGGVWVDLKSGQGFFNTAAGDRLFGIENLEGSQHSDMLIGDDGANSIRGYNGDDTLKGGGGADYLRSDFGNDNLQGGDGDDYLWGGFGDDILDGGNDNDILEGLAGNDTMIGGSGNDTYYADAGDVISEAPGGGNDVVFAYSNFALSANIETLSLVEGVYGTGSAQANVIYGNGNGNVLEGGGGADFINGLGGNDNFVFRPGDANGDAIYDFQGNGAAVGDFMYFIGYGTAAQGANFVQLSANTWQINSADGLTHDVVTFSGNTSIGSGDFVFI